jgi:hypothetical protein
MNYLELVQHFRGSSHRHKSVACPKFDMVWLYRSPIPVGGGGGGDFLGQIISTASPCVEKGEGMGVHPVIGIRIEARSRHFQNKYKNKWQADSIVLYYYNFNL